MLLTRRGISTFLNSQLREVRWAPPGPPRHRPGAAEGAYLGGRGDKEPGKEELGGVFCILQGPFGAITASLGPSRPRQIPSRPPVIGRGPPRGLLRTGNSDKELCKEDFSRPMA